jgi:predicted aconitase/predicted aconitase with swiveling domain
VQGDRNRHRGRLLDPSPLLISTEPLSFWGGIDPLSGIVIDSTHPLAGQSVTDTILCLPSGRGSCTASQVLLELILNGIAPRAIVLRDVDGLAAVGALIAQEVFLEASMDILHIGKEGYHAILCSSNSHGVISSNGELALSRDVESLTRTVFKPHTIVKKAIDASNLSFTNEEQKMLEDCDSEAAQMALRVLFHYAHMTSPPNTVPTYLKVTKAHIDGCTYIGPGGLAFCQRLVKAKGHVSVPTTLNSMSADRQRWQVLGVPTKYAHNAIALGDAYLQLGCLHSFTCAPYILNNPPTLGEHLVWGESNAVVYANSVLGARTEKYADYLDICCAIAGMVPAAGVHLEENRRPRIVLDATPLVESLDLALVDLDMFFPLLGHLCGSLSDGNVPILLGLEPLSSSISLDHLKSFCAAFGTTASSPLIHISKVTPEAQDEGIVKAWIQACGDKTETISTRQLRKTFEKLDGDRDGDGKVNLIALGNPHLSVSECRDLVNLIELPHISNNHKVKHPEVRVIACMARSLQLIAEEAGYVGKLRDFGVEFINDTCWCMLLDEPVIPIDPSSKILTNSGKYAHYGPGLTSRKFRFGSTSDCVQAAFTGVYPNKVFSDVSPSSWLMSRPQIMQRRTFKTSIHSIQRIVLLLR